MIAMMEHARPFEPYVSSLLAIVARYASGVAVHRAPSQTRSGAGPSDAALVIEARAGEAWAHEALFRRHARRLNGLAFRILGRDDEIDDLVQDTFIVAFRTLGRLADPQAFASWSASILVRQAYKKLRTRRLLARIGIGRREEAIDVDAIASASATPEEAAELRAIYAVLHAMPADVRIALVLHRIEALSLEETASVMDVSIATVKRRIAEADVVLSRSR
jgi:RNA polymerase sigma-70 factor, ECF subfamily